MLPVAVSTERKGERPSRLEIYRSETEGCILRGLHLILLEIPLMTLMMSVAVLETEYKDSAPRL